MEIQWGVICIAFWSRRQSMLSRSGFGLFSLIILGALLNLDVQETMAPICIANISYFIGENRAGRRKDKTWHQYGWHKRGSGDTHQFWMIFPPEEANDNTKNDWKMGMDHFQTLSIFLLQTILGFCLIYCWNYDRICCPFLIGCIGRHIYVASLPFILDE